MKTFRDQSTPDGITIRVMPRKRSDDGWYWYPVVSKGLDGLTVTLTGEDHEQNRSYGEAVALGKRWAEEMRKLFANYPSEEGENDE